MPQQGRTLQIRGNFVDFCLRKREVLLSIGLRQGELDRSKMQWITLFGPSSMGNCVEGYSILSIPLYVLSGRIVKSSRLIKPYEDCIPRTWTPRVRDLTEDRHLSTSIA